MSHMRVSKSVEKAFQLAFLKLKRRRKGVVVGVTAALIRMAIGRCWVCGIGSSTALLLSDAMLLLTKERSGLYPRFQRLLSNEQGSFGSCIKLKWWASDHSSTRSPFSSVLLYPLGGAVAIEVANDHIGIVIVQGIWVIKLELSSWWFVDRSYDDTANVDGKYLNVVVLGH